LRCLPWWIVWSVIEIGTIPFREPRSSHSDIPTSSTLNTNSAQEPGRCLLRHYVIVSRNDGGISSRDFSWSRLIISDNSSLWRSKKESTPPAVTAAPKASRQCWSSSVRLTAVWFWAFFLIQALSCSSIFSSSTGRYPRPLGMAAPFSKACQTSLDWTSKAQAMAFTANRL
jgi:hypothetical protein